MVVFFHLHTHANNINLDSYDSDYLSSNPHAFLEFQFSDCLHLLLFISSSFCHLISLNSYLPCTGRPFSCFLSYTRSLLYQPQSSSLPSLPSSILAEVSSDWVRDLFPLVNSSPCRQVRGDHVSLPCFLMIHWLFLGSCGSELDGYIY